MTTKETGKNQQDQMYDTAIQLIGEAVKLPLVRVNREEFLRKQFAKSEYLEQIMANGPQSVYSVESLRKKANRIIDDSTNMTSLASFATGLPSNLFIMGAAGAADVVQYFGFALNMAQQIAYLFGEDELFDGTSEQVSDDAKIRIIAYLGVMLGAGGATVLISQTSKIAGQNLGKKVAAKALTKTAWYPFVKKVGAIIGQKVTKQTVQKVITKSVPIIGGVISGGLTYMTFKPMGERLADTLVKNIKGEFEEELELNSDFLDTINKKENELIGEFTEIEDDML